MTYQPPPHGFRTFLVVWLTQSVSVIGSALTVFAINIYLTQVLYPRPEQKPELAFALAAFNIAFAVPVVFGAPLAGAWADRHDRKRTMIAMDVLNGALSLVGVWLMATHALQLWMLLVGGALVAFVSAFHGAAFDTSYAMLVNEQQLPRANGMMQTIWALSGVISPAIAALLIALPGLARQGVLPALIAAPLAPLDDGTPLAIGMDALTFFLAAFVLLFLHVPSPQRSDLTTSSGKRKSFWADVVEGGRYIWHRRPLLWLLGTFAVANFTLTPYVVLMPLLVKFNLAADWAAQGYTFETALALLSSVIGLGGVVGGVLISVWGGLKSQRVYGVVIPMLIAGLAGILLGLSSLLYLSAIAVFIDSIMGPFLNAHSQAIWQAQTPHELQGRVFSVRRLIAQFTWPLSTALVGWTAGLFNAGYVVAAMGAILVLFCVAQLFNPYLLRVEDKAWLDQLAARKVTSDG